MTSANTMKKGLGRGLGALIPSGSVFTGGRTIINVDIDRVVPNPRQPRTAFNDQSLAELAESIKAKGIAQPVLVRMRQGAYELVAGERRLRAAKLAGLKNVPAIVKDFTDQESMELALIENLQREDLNPMDEAEAFATLSKEFSLTQAEISQKVGKDRSTVANMLRLMDLPEQAKEALRAGKLSAGHARALLALKDKDKILAALKEIIENRLSVRDIETVVSQETPKTRRSKARPAGNPELKNQAEKLASHLGTKVRIFGQPKKGKIVIDYFSQEDLERLLELLTAA